MCNQHQLDLSYRVIGEEASSSCIHEQISLTSFKGTAIPVWTVTRELSKSHIASQQGSGEQPPIALLYSSQGTTMPQRVQGYKLRSLMEISS